MELLQPIALLDRKDGPTDGVVDLLQRSAGRWSDKASR